ncbi:MAG: HPr family phosphocarrier protein [Oscillibacter sp.]|jgi:phosphocarrier protein HPr|nr:HPr family phosphocarrier protein [Oscillibacter sp.]
MVEKKTVIQNATGLHARPASQLTQLCKKFPESIRLVDGEKSVDPKSIIALLSAGLKCGTPITVQVTGDQEEAVCGQIVAFIESLTE